MSSTTLPGPAPDSPSGVRPLPPRPSLEFERRAAKKLLGQLRRGDPEALRRALAHRDESRIETGFKLADAQFIIAREYGFRSWPRLIEYFTVLERHERSVPWNIVNEQECQHEVDGLLAELRRKSEFAATLLVNFHPRFFGLDVATVFDSGVTVDDARLVVARQHLAPSWDVLLERVKHNPPDDAGDWDRYESPLERARYAIRAGDLARLAAIVEEHPDLVHTPRPGERYDHSLISAALHSEHHAVVGRPARGPRRPPSQVSAADARRTTDWLIERGADPAPVLNRKLLGHAVLATSAADVRFWLTRGADPGWTPPNGIPVLEHALYLYRDREAIDVLASHVVPREGLWIAAGLGDLHAMNRCFDRNGQLTPVARRTRPDFAATGRLMLSLPDADDMEIMWEAFYVAGLNQRFAAMDRLLEAGLPVDYARGWTLLQAAVERRSVPLVDFLVSRGASAVYSEWAPNTTARDIAMMYLRSDPWDAEGRRIVELLGGNPDDAARDTRGGAKAPELAPPLIEALNSAAADAARRAQAAVEPLDIFAALLRGAPGSRGSTLPMVYLAMADTDMPRLRRLLGDRLESPPETVGESQLPFSDTARAVMDAAGAKAREANRSSIHALHVMWALAANASGPVAEMLRASGTAPTRLMEALSQT